MKSTLSLRWPYSNPALRSDASILALSLDSQALKPFCCQRPGAHSSVFQGSCPGVLVGSQGEPLETSGQRGRSESRACPISVRHCPDLWRGTAGRGKAASRPAERSFLQLDRSSSNLLGQVQTELWVHEAAGMETPEQRVANLLQGSLGDVCLFLSIPQAGWTVL